MNNIQDAIARVTGISSIVEAQEARMGEMVAVQEHIVADNQMLRRELEDLDYLNLFDPSQMLEVLPIRDRAKALARLRRLRHDNPLAKQSVKLIVRFTLGQGIQYIVADEQKPGDVPGTPTPPPSGDSSQNGSNGSQPPRTPITDPTKLVTLATSTRSEKTVIGDTTKPQSDPTRDIIDAFWTDDENELAFTSHEALQQLIDDIATDGEKFFTCFEDSSEPYVRVAEIPVEQVKQIIYNPNNRLQPVLYKRSYIKSKYNSEHDAYEPQGNPITEYYLDYRITPEKWVELKKDIKVPEAKIAKDDNRKPIKVFHCGINWLWTKNGRRGISELYASREWFRVFREFMEGRAAINSAAQAISYLRKIKGGPAAVAQFGGKFGGLDVGQSAGSDTDELRKLSQPVKGAVYDTNEAVDLSWLRTDTGAQNAKEDGRMLLMSAGAGVSTFIHYFGEGGDANLATAQSMELPMVKNYEDWQSWTENFLIRFFRYVLTVATDLESAKSEVKRVGFTFPPIISQDVVKYTTSWAQIVRDIAPNNLPVRRQAIRAVLSVMGVPNIDGLMPEIEAAISQAEELRKQQQQHLLEIGLNNPNNGQMTPSPGKNAPPPPAGIPGNLAHLAAGKGEKVANGPKAG